MTADALTHDRGTEEAYERLRVSVVDSTLGLALLMREGVAAWMAAASTRAPTISQQTIPCSTESRRAKLDLDELHAGVVRVLASMAFAQIEERKTT